MIDLFIYDIISSVLYMVYIKITFICNMKRKKFDILRVKFEI